MEPRVEPASLPPKLMVFPSIPENLEGGKKTQQSQVLSRGPISSPHPGSCLQTEDRNSLTGCRLLSGEHNLLVSNSFFKKCIDLGEGKREGERNIGLLLHPSVHSLGASLCTLTRDRTRDPGPSGPCSRRLSFPARAPNFM